LYLKEIGEIAGLTTPVRIIRFTGTKEVQIRQPKFEFMSAHMARRTFVTIMLEKGVPITVVQKIIQHSDIRMLMKYESHGENAIFESQKKTKCMFRKFIINRTGLRNVLTIRGQM